MISFLPVFLTFILIIVMLGIILNKRNILILIMCLETAMFSLLFLFYLYGMVFDDIVGIIMSFMLITIAGAETSVGLALIIAYFRATGSFDLKYTKNLI